MAGGVAPPAPDVDPPPPLELPHAAANNTTEVATAPAAANRLSRT